MTHDTATFLAIIVQKVIKTDEGHNAQLHIQKIKKVA